MLQSPSYSDNSWRRTTTGSPCSNTQHKKIQKSKHLLMLICKNWDYCSTSEELKTKELHDVASTSSCFSVTVSHKGNINVAAVTIVSSLTSLQPLFRVYHAVVIRLNKAVEPHPILYQQWIVYCDIQMFSSPRCVCVL